MKTLTTEQVLQHMADNVRAGKSPVDGLECVIGGNEWGCIGMGMSLAMLMSEVAEFRLAPRTHTINGYEVPALEIEEPEDGAEYWVVNPFHEDGVNMYKWVDDETDQNAIRNGLWLSKEDAIANAKALRGEDPYKEAE